MLPASRTISATLVVLLALGLVACRPQAPVASAEPAPPQRAGLSLPTAIISATSQAFGLEPALGRSVANTATPAPPTSTPEPPTATPAPPTSTPEPPAATPVPPTSTPEPPTATPVPPAATPEPFGAISAGVPEPQRIIISSIGLDRSLVSVGLDAADTPVVPDYDAAWYNRSARPGDGDNVVVWGHALRFQATPDRPAPFEQVKLASVGDTVRIVTADGATFDYVIREQIWARPDEVGYILPKGSERLTIVNCIGDIVITNGEVDMSHRLITIAEPQF